MARRSPGHAINKTQQAMSTARKRNNQPLEINELEALILSLANFSKQRAR